MVWKASTSGLLIEIQKAKNLQVRMKITKKRLTNLDSRFASTTRSI